MCQVLTSMWISSAINVPMSHFIAFSLEKGKKLSLKLWQIEIFPSESPVALSFIYA